MSSMPKSLSTALSVFASTALKGRHQLSERWLKFLNDSCGHLPPPKTRYWGGTYFEVLPVALPSELRLLRDGAHLSTSKETESRGKGLSSSEQPNCVPSVEAPLGGSGVISCVPPIPDELVLSLFRVKSITHLRPLQQLLLPLFSQSHTDVVVAAHYGSGKSLAAVMAMLYRHWMTSASVTQHNPRLSPLPICDGNVGDPRNPLCVGTEIPGQAKVYGPNGGNLHSLILVPTRDMVFQTYSLVSDVSRYLAVRVGVLVGGLRDEGHVKEPWLQFHSLLVHPPDVLICTPGKLEEFINFLFAIQGGFGEAPKDSACKRHLGGRSQELPTLSVFNQCKHLIVEDASLQMQEPGMLRTLLKLKELLPPGAARADTGGRRQVVNSLKFSLSCL